MTENYDFCGPQGKKLGQKRPSIKLTKQNKHTYCNFYFESEGSGLWALGSGLVGPEPEPEPEPEVGPLSSFVF